MNSDKPSPSENDSAEIRVTTWTVQEETHRIGDARSYKPTPNEYMLHRLIAKGGGGEVWEAVQTSLWRVVAVKRIDQDFVRENRTRPRKLSNKEIEFQQEAVVTALLDHPGIVPIYDLGKSEDDQPLLAMKLVRGERWSDLIARELTEIPFQEYIARQIPILMQMAQAVSFAHSRGIVHRDLKPSQVMIGHFGEVYLMDWGLAVYVGGELGMDAELVPEVLELLPKLETSINPAGTPGMMAPEQTESHSRNISSATDIFLLGATLYWLLTGTTPHTGKTMTDVIKAARVCDLEAPEKRAPHHQIPATLSMLAMRCMRRDAAERVPSAKAFIMTLQDYLSGAIDRAESARFVEESRRRLEENGTDSSSGEVPTALPVTWKKNWGRPRASSYDVYTEVLNLLDQALQLWPQNPDVHDLRAGVLAGYAWAAVESSDLRLARALALRIETPAHRKAVIKIVRRRERRAADHTRQRIMASVTVAVMAVVLFFGGVKYTSDLRKARQRSDAARADAEQVLNFLLGSLHRDLSGLGRLQVLESISRQAILYYESLPKDEMNDASFAAYEQALRQLGDVHLYQGNLEAAEASLQKSLTISDKRIDMQTPLSTQHRLENAQARCSLGDVYKRQGNIPMAEEQFQTALNTLKTLDKSNLSASVVDESIARVKGQMGNVELAKGNYDSARELFEEQLAIRTALLAEAPRDVARLDTVSTTHLQLGWAFFAAGHFAEYKDQLRLSLDVRKRALDLEPTSSTSRFMLARTELEMARAQFFADELDDSLATGTKARDKLVVLVNGDTRNSEWRDELGGAEELLAEVYLARNQPAEAESRVNASLAIRQERWESTPANPTLRSFLMKALRLAATIVAMDPDRTTQALDLATKSAEIAGAMKDTQGNNVKWSREIWRAVMLKSTLQFKRGDLAAAKVSAQDAIEAARGLEPFHVTAAEQIDPPKESGAWMKKLSGASASKPGK